MKLKVCGMKYQDNIMDVACLQPDYLGFIFYDHSVRNMESTIPEITDAIRKVAVFVNEDIERIISLVNQYRFDAIQLHGEEKPAYCERLRALLKEETNKIDVSIIKAFSVDDSFDFKNLVRYDDCCDYYLFDTKGELPGGNGVAFDWNLLANYNGDKPFFLSGGIGLDALNDLHEFKQSKLAQYCHAIDVNSRFEDKPGFKNIEKLKEFKSEL